MTREELIAALEKATGPSRELNFRIAEMLGDVPAHTVRKVGGDYNWYRTEGDFTLWRARDSEGRNVEYWSAPAYTASIDAALTLVPEGAGIELRRYWITTGIGDAVCVALDGPQAGCVWSALVSWGTDGQTAEAEDKPNPAIALCIAALRARA